MRAERKTCVDISVRRHLANGPDGYIASPPALRHRIRVLECFKDERLPTRAWGRDVEPGTGHSAYRPQSPAMEGRGKVADVKGRIVKSFKGEAVVETLRKLAG
ncbi:hypothetical protein PCAR4_290030 [Paraburkholderia caribensis]|nr:hypothetical protein PCAR4_290030 [Paraburkholderia caribensis]